MNDRKNFLRILLASSIGGVMEYYDFVIFILFAGIISQVFISPKETPFLALIMTYGMFAVGYFVRPLGGIILGHFGDKYGRKKIKWASEGLKQTWAMRRSHLSPRYTTHWQEIPVAHA